MRKLYPNLGGGAGSGMFAGEKILFSPTLFVLDPTPEGISFFLFVGKCFQPNSRFGDIFSEANDEVLNSLQKGKLILTWFGDSFDGGFFYLLVQVFSSFDKLPDFLS